MHHIHILTTGADGRISISKAELENLLAIAYHDGLEEGKKECKATHDNTYDDGYKAGYAAGMATGGNKAIYPGKDSHEFYWSVTNPNHNFITPTVTCAHEDDKCTSDNEKNHDKIVKTNSPAIHATYTVTPEQAKKLSEQVSELFSANSISTVNDVFANLKKELGL